MLTALMFAAERVGPSATPATPEDDVTPQPPEDAGTSEPSVRPPDLPPETVRDTPDDVLAGWDVGVDASEVAAWRRDERPVPVDTIAVAGGGLVGTVLGAILWSEHRARGAGMGALAGVVVVAAGRRIWRLEG